MSTRLAWEPGEPVRAGRREVPIEAIESLAIEPTGANSANGWLGVVSGRPIRVRLADDDGEARTAWCAIRCESFAARVSRVRRRLHNGIVVNDRVRVTTRYLQGAPVRWHADATVWHRIPFLGWRPLGKSAADAVVNLPGEVKVVTHTDEKVRPVQVRFDADVVQHLHEERFTQYRTSERHWSETPPSVTETTLEGALLAGTLTRHRHKYARRRYESIARALAPLVVPDGDDEAHARWCEALARCAGASLPALVMVQRIERSAPPWRGVLVEALGEAMRDHAIPDDRGLVATLVAHWRGRTHTHAPHQARILAHWGVKESDPSPQEVWKRYRVVRTEALKRFHAGDRDPWWHVQAEFEVLEREGIVRRSESLQTYTERPAEYSAHPDS